MKIITTDPRLSEDRICVSAENVSVSIASEPIRKIYASENEDGTISEVVVNEPQLVKETTLKEETAKLQYLIDEVIGDQNALDCDTALRDAQQALVDSMTPVITEAIQAQSERIALLPKEEAPAEPIEEPLEP